MAAYAPVLAALLLQQPTRNEVAEAQTSNSSHIESQRLLEREVKERVRQERQQNRLDQNRRQDQMAILVFVVLALAFFVFLIVIIKS